MIQRLPRTSLSYTTQDPRDCFEWLTFCSSGIWAKRCLLGLVVQVSYQETEAEVNSRQIWAT